VRQELVHKTGEALRQHAEFASVFEHKAETRLIDRNAVRKGRACLARLQTLADEDGKESVDLWRQVDAFFESKASAAEVAPSKAESAAPTALSNRTGPASSEAAVLLQRLRRRKQALATIIRDALGTRRQSSPKRDDSTQDALQPLLRAPHPQAEAVPPDQGALYEKMCLDACCALHLTSLAAFRGQRPELVRDDQVHNVSTSTTRMNGRAVTKLHYRSTGAQGIDFEEVHFRTERPETREECSALLREFASDFLIGSTLAHALGLAALAPHVVACGFAPYGHETAIFRPRLKGPLPTNFVKPSDHACQFDAQCAAQTCSVSGLKILSAQDARCVKGACYSKKSLALYCKRARALRHASAPATNDEHRQWQARSAEALSSKDPTEAQRAFQALSAEARKRGGAEAQGAMRLLGLGALRGPQQETLQRKYAEARESAENARGFIQAARDLYLNEAAPGHEAELRRLELHRALQVRRLHVPSLSDLDAAGLRLEDVYRALRASAGADVAPTFRPWSQIARGEGASATRETVRAELTNELARVKEEVAEAAWERLLLAALESAYRTAGSGDAPEAPLEQLLRPMNGGRISLKSLRRTSETLRDATGALARLRAAIATLEDKALPRTLLLLLGDAEPREHDVDLLRKALREFNGAADADSHAKLLARLLEGLEDAYDNSRIRPGHNERQEPEGVPYGLLWSKREIRQFLRNQTRTWELRPAPLKLRELCRLPNNELIKVAEGAPTIEDEEERTPVLELHAWRALSAARSVGLLEDVFLQALNPSARRAETPGDLAHGAAGAVFHLASVGVAFPAMRITDFSRTCDRVLFARADLEVFFRNGEPGRAWDALAAFCMLDALFFTTYLDWRLAITQMVLESNAPRPRPRGNTAAEKRLASAYAQLHDSSGSALLQEQLTIKFQALVMRDLWPKASEPSQTLGGTASRHDSTFFSVLGQHILELWSADSAAIASCMRRPSAAVQGLLRAHRDERAAALSSWKAQMTVLLGQSDRRASSAWLLPLDTERALFSDHLARWEPPNSNARLVTFETELQNAPRDLRALLRRFLLLPGETAAQVPKMGDAQSMRPHLGYKPWPARSPVDIGLEALAAASRATFAASSALVLNAVERGELPERCPEAVPELGLVPPSAWLPCAPDRCPSSSKWRGTLPWSCAALKGGQACRGPLWALSSFVTLLPQARRGDIDLVAYVYNGIEALPARASRPGALVVDDRAGLAIGARRLFIAQNTLLDSLFLLHAAVHGSSLSGSSDPGQGEPKCQRSNGASSAGASAVSEFLGGRAAALTSMALAHSESVHVQSKEAMGAPDVLIPFCASAASLYSEAKDALAATVRALAWSHSASARVAERLDAFWQRPSPLDIAQYNSDLLIFSAGQLFGPTWQRL
jgi:hypothetical protein